MDKFQVLKQFFGYDGFRPGQEKLIDAILSGRDVLGILPTGSRKVYLFSDSGSDDGRYYTCDISPYFSYEGSGGIPQPGRVMQPI